ncbi:MAG: hypothetical protein WBE64_18435, partial [Xanthobacteraceae bacterium]
APGLQRRVIEGEGLGGFARRLTVNGTAGESFRREPCFSLHGWGRFSLCLEFHCGSTSGAGVPGTMPNQRNSR